MAQKINSKKSKATGKKVATATVNAELKGSPLTDTRPEPKRYTEELTALRESLITRLNSTDPKTPASVQLARDQLMLLKEVDSPYW